MALQGLVRQSDQGQMLNLLLKVKFIGLSWLDRYNANLLLGLKMVSINLHAVAIMVACKIVQIGKNKKEEMEYVTIVFQSREVGVKAILFCILPPKYCQLFMACTVKLNAHKNTSFENIAF